MADDALYLAAIHHRQEYGPKETSKIVENMQRIVRDHPDGDIVKRYGQTNRFLAQALERERLGK